MPQEFAPNFARRLLVDRSFCNNRHARNQQIIHKLLHSPNRPDHQFTKSKITKSAQLSAGTGPLVSSMVLGVSPREPALLAAIVAILALITLLSSAGPLRRSLRVDPLTALREE